jgi:hypothetical protein
VTPIYVSIQNTRPIGETVDCADVSMEQAKMPSHGILPVSASSQVVNGFIENFLTQPSVNASRRYATFVE